MNSLNIIVESGGQLGLNRQIADQLSSKIHSGELLPESKLPSEQTLANELNVTRDVIRRAYKLLKQSGLIESQPHKEWRVASHP